MFSAIVRVLHRRPWKTAATAKRYRSPLSGPEPLDERIVPAGPSSFQVDNLLGVGPGSLADAIAYSNAAAPPAGMMNYIGFRQVERMNGPICLTQPLPALAATGPVDAL